MRRVIFREHRAAYQRRGQQHTVRTGDVVGGPARVFIPASGEFLPEPGLKREVAPDPDRVLDVPSSEQTSPTQRIVVGHNLKIRERSLQEGRQGTEGRHPQPSRSRVFILLHSLKPDTGADLMDALDDLDAVRVSK